MHTLSDIRNLAVRALDEDDPAVQAQFRAVLDPGTVLALTDAVVALLTYVEGEGVDDFSAKEVAGEVRRHLGASGIGPGEGDIAD